MRYFAAAVALIVFVLPAIGQEHGKPADKKHANVQNPCNATTVVVNSPTSDQNQKQPETQSSKRPPLWDIYWPSLGLVILGAVGTIIAICTLRDLKRQTNATRVSARAARDAASAARTNADAIINSERAWIVAELKPEAIKGGETPQQWLKVKDHAPLTVSEIVRGQHLFHSLFVTNIGRTPAHLLSFTINYTCLPEGVADLDPKIMPDYSAVHEFVHLLPGNTGIEILARFDIFSLIEKSWKEIQNLKKTAVFHGSVKYKNIFGLPTECSSEFCYVYTVSLERLSNVGRHTRYH